MPAPTHHLLYFTSGDPANPPLIFVHGLLSHRGVWRTTLPVLEKEFYCVAVDLPGFGDNTQSIDGDYSIPTQAQRVLKLADELNFDKFSLIGHSMGGQIATYLAAKLAPERVERLISVDGVVTGKLSRLVETRTQLNIAMGYYIPAGYGLFRNWVEKSRWLAHFTFRPWFYDMNQLPFDEWKIDRQMALQPALASSAYQAYHALHALDLTPHLPNINAKTLVLFGDNDNTVPPDQAYTFKSAQPAAEIVIFERCGHFPMFEKRVEYLATLRRFLEIQ